MCYSLIKVCVMEMTELSECIPIAGSGSLLDVVEHVRSITSYSDFESSDEDVDGWDGLNLFVAQILAEFEDDKVGYADVEVDGIVEELDEAVECSICQDMCTCVYLLECGHVFHCKCLDMWVCRSETCPVCRMKVKTKLKSIN